MCSVFNKYTDQVVLMTDEDFSIDLFRAGDEQLFNRVYSYYYKPLHYFAMSFLNDRQQADEVVSDTMVKLWRGKENFRSAGNIRAFLYIATKNSCFDLLKHTKYRVKADAAISRDTDLASQEPEVLARILESELLQRIDAELRKLPARQQDVFRRSFMEGRSNEEIAMELGITANSVYVNKSMAVTALRKALRQYYPLMILFSAGTPF